MRVFFKVWLVVFILCFTLPGEAKVNLPHLISDGVMLQRGEELTIWGEANPGEEIILTFEEEGGNLIQENNLKGFAIAGIDGKFVWAQAHTQGNRMIVRADEVSQPVMVRYAWADNPGELNLRNTEGLPATPFRTDY